MVRGCRPAPMRGRREPVSMLSVGFEQNPNERELDMSEPRYERDINRRPSPNANRA
jgi:hypothetical protein